MGKTCKVVVCGQAAVGKTAILEQLINGDHVVGSVSEKLIPRVSYRTGCSAYPVRDIFFQCSRQRGHSSYK